MNDCGSQERSIILLTLFGRSAEIWEGSILCTLYGVAFCVCGVSASNIYLSWLKPDNIFLRIFFKSNYMDKGIRYLKASRNCLSLFDWLFVFLKISPIGLIKLCIQRNILRKRTLNSEYRNLMISISNEVLPDLKK